MFLLKIVVTGGNGFLGAKAAKILSEQGFDVVPSTRTGENGALKMDITNRATVFEALSKARPDALVHTAAVTNVDWCERHQRETLEVNVAGTKNLADACRETGTKMLLVSSDFVFDGLKDGCYGEADAPNPANFYARSKLLAEQAVQKTLEDWLICRVIVLYGYNSPHDKPCFPAWVLEMLETGKKFGVVADQKTCPSLIDDVARAFGLLLKKNAKEIYHVSSGDCVSKYDFAVNTAKTFGFDTGAIVPQKTSESPLAAPRAPRLCMNASKLAKEGFKLRNTTEGLKEYQRQKEEGVTQK